MMVHCTRLVRVAALSLLLFCLLPLAASQAAPSGSYEGACSEIQWDGRVLSAQCSRMDGSQKFTELAFAASCQGNISSVDGNLVCVGPAGSFAQTCRNIAVEGDTVYAECQDMQGNWITTRHKVPGYGKPLDNCNGRLKSGCN